MFENESKKNEGYILKGLNSPPQIGKLGHMVYEPICRQRIYASSSLESKCWYSDCLVQFQIITILVRSIFTVLSIEIKVWNIAKDWVLTTVFR